MHKELAEKMRQHPELIPSASYFEMTREEQMKYWWEKTKLQKQHDKQFWFSTLESGVFDRNIAMPGVPVYQLHYGMFMSGI